MCATDIVSRGIDTYWVKFITHLSIFYLFIQVEHVIQFDFPRFMSDYIHRAGRVGRIGSKKPGKVSSFVTRPYEINLAQKIEVRINENLFPYVFSFFSTKGHCSYEQKT
jgi:superfamily II DNA/RNA helicase